MIRSDLSTQIWVGANDTYGKSNHGQPRTKHREGTLPEFISPIPRSPVISSMEALLAYHVTYKVLTEWFTVSDWIEEKNMDIKNSRLGV